MSTMLTIRRYGDPVLRRKARRVKAVDETIRRLAGEMAELMKRQGGVGLAANQVGERIRLIVVDPSAGEHPEEYFALVNPVITAREGFYEDEEGCLCFPGLRIPIRRALNVKAEGLDLNGNPVFHEGRGLLARILQHEIDHLDGIMMVDRLPFLKRLAMKLKLPRMKRKYRKEREKPADTA